MRNRAFRSQKLAPTPTRLESLTLPHLKRCCRDWLNDCEYRQHSPQTIASRRFAVERLQWFLDHETYTECGTSELRAFFTYLAKSHEAPEGRWGNPRFNKPLRPRTIKDFHGHFRCLFNWLLEDGEIEISPMERIAPPISRADQIQPFSAEQIDALLQAARNSRQPKRNEAMILFALDTGLRRSEICALSMKDVDLVSNSCRVKGKGNKHRTVYFGRTTSKVIHRYLREHERTEEDAVFLSSDCGHSAGERLTGYGFNLLLRRLGKAAQIRGVRCSPHTLRHTMAITFLRNGGNIWSLKEILGHTHIQMTLRYSAVAEADIELQHKRFSPVDGLHLLDKQNRL